MTFLELANRRFSVRGYTTKTIPKEAIESCLEAARLAPSACNAQPWYFIIVDDPALKESVCAAAFSGIYSMNSFVDTASAIAIVIMEKASQLAAAGGLFRNVQYNLIDIGVACGYFMLKAAEDGIGTCCIGWFNEKAVKKLLGIAKNKKACLIISMGYPAEDSKRPRMRKSLSEISRFNA